MDAIPEGRWVGNLDIPEWSTMVCIESGEYIRTSSFCKSKFQQYPDSGEVISIYFLPDYMGKGYGGKLLDVVMKELKKQGFTEVFLWVMEENSRARAFYENYGFKCTDDLFGRLYRRKGPKRSQVCLPFRIALQKLPSSAPAASRRAEGGRKPAAANRRVLWETPREDKLLIYKEESLCPIKSSLWRTSPS